MFAETVTRDGRSADWTSMTDEALVARCQQGDNAAFDVIYTRYRDRIRAVVWKFVTDAADAEDLVQEVFLKAYCALPRFRGACKPYTWLYQIAVNSGINSRQRHRAEYSNTEVREPQTDIGPEREASSANRQRKAMEAIGELSPPLSAALLSNVVCGYDYADVGDLLGCPIGTVRSRISRARRAVADAVAD